jgi:ubiquinone biosynthesis protein
LASVIANLFRLARAGLTLARYGVSFVPKGMKVPPVLRLARWLAFPITVLTWPLRAATPRHRRTAEAFARLGPSYIKLGQFLATREDVIGPDLARDLRHLQDRLAPFPMSEARRAIE